MAAIRPGLAGESGCHRADGFGESDIVPMGPVRYARSFQKCFILAAASGASQCASSRLISRVPIHHLDGKNISVPASFETAAVLLRVIMDVSGVKANYVTTGESSCQSSPDPAALTRSHRPFGSQGETEPGLYVYDLDELWSELTGELAIPRLWVLRHESAVQFYDRIESILHSNPRFEELFGAGFSQAQRKALLRFYAYAQILDLVPPKITLKIWGEELLGQREHAAVFARA